jgi:serine protease Do
LPSACDYGGISGGLDGRGRCPFFMDPPLDQRIKLQVLLTAAGYWPAVPNENFNERILTRSPHSKSLITSKQLATSAVIKWIVSFAIGDPLLNLWGFKRVIHSMTPISIWVPLGLGLYQQTIDSGLSFQDPQKRITLNYNFYPRFALRRSFGALYNDLTARGYKILYSKVYRDDVFVVSASNDVTDTPISPMSSPQRSSSGRSVSSRSSA